MCWLKEEKVMCSPEVAFPQGEEEKDVGMMPEEMWTPKVPPARVEGGREEQGWQFLADNLAALASLLLLGGTPHLELVLFCPSLRIAAEPGLPFPFPLCFTPRWAQGSGSSVF